MTRFVSLLALVLATRAVAGSAVTEFEFCLNNSSFIPDNIAYAYCYSYAPGAHLNCPVGCSFGTNYCSCGMSHAAASSAAACEAALNASLYSNNGYPSFYSSTCADNQYNTNYNLPFNSSKRDWCAPYSVNPTGSYLSSITQSAGACCSDKMSICEEFNFDICLNDDFQPDLITSQYSRSTAFPISDDCKGNCSKFGGSYAYTYMSSGSMVCICDDIARDAAIAMDPGAIHYATTCRGALSSLGNSLQYTESEMCNSPSVQSTLSYLPEKCCTSGLSTCNQYYEGLCKNDDLLLDAASTTCTQFYDSAEDLAAAACPSKCTAGFSQGLAGAETAVTEGTLDYHKNVGWCPSDLNENPPSLAFNTMFTLDQCWDACVHDFGADTVHNVEYECVVPVEGFFSYGYSFEYSSCWCYCQSSCGCMASQGLSSTAFYQGEQVPEACVYSYSHGYNASAAPQTYLDYGLDNSPFYFCECENSIGNKAACEAELGAGAYFKKKKTCLKHAVTGNRWSGDGAYYIDSVISMCAGEGSYDYSESAAITLWAPICCASGEANGVCPAQKTGTCFSGSSEITVLRAGAGAPVSMKLSEAKVGDHVLASSAQHLKPEYTKITALPHSRSTGSFVHIEMEAHKADHFNKKLQATVTEHHTFPACGAHGGMVVAKHLKVGDCLLSADGEKRSVAHVGVRAANPWDETFSVVLEGDRDRLAVGGIITHASPAVHSAAEEKAERAAAERRNQQAAHAAHEAAVLATIARNDKEGEAATHKLVHAWHAHEAEKDKAGAAKHATPHAAARGGK